MVYTPRAMGLSEGARYLLLDDDLTQAAYIKMKNETEEILASGYSPEFDDTLETGKLLRDFGNLLRGTSVAHLNWLLRTMLNVVYVYPWWKEVIGLAPKDAFYEPIQAMAGGIEVAVFNGSSGSSGRSGGDGGESNSPSRRAYNPDVLQACPAVCSWTLQIPPTRSGEAQPVYLWPPLPASGRPHPGLMAPASPHPGVAGSRRSGA